MNFSTDQLSYILERKFINLQVGNQALIVCSAIGPNENGAYIPVNDAYIIQWNLSYIPKPTTEELEQWWEVLEDQYNSDPSRIDSDMYKLVNGVEYNRPVPVTVNMDI
jgi:hypothetical protein